MLDFEGLGLLREALEALEAGFAGLPPLSPHADLERLRPALLAAAERMRDNYPYPHPLYAGQMLKPPHPVARLAYALSLWINPNNHALDGGRASSAMEKEAVADIARMFGWEEGGFLGHLCGGGTMANLEALWVAREVAGGGTGSPIIGGGGGRWRGRWRGRGRDRGRGKPRPYTGVEGGGGYTVLASEQAHYTHRRLSGVLGVPFEAMATDRRGRMDARALEARLRAGGVGTVVATLGVTATGACDPLPAILALRERYGFRLHVDAAYGGYLTLAANLAPETRAAFDRIGEADSIVVDPHKHGLQPYGCGCVLFRDPAVGRVYKHDSPYTYFSSSELHLGEISLECSRPGAAAVALWATQRLLPLVRGGEFAGMLEACREAALALYGRLADDPRFMTAFAPELDIVVWAPRAATVEEASARSRRIFERAAERDLHLALATLPARFFGGAWPEAEAVDGGVMCLRSCLMKPEHRDWLDAIWTRLEKA